MLRSKQVESTAIKLFHMHSWVGISYRGKLCGGYAAAVITICVDTSKDLGPCKYVHWWFIMCWSLPHYRNYRHTKPIIDYHNMQYCINIMADLYSNTLRPFWYAGGVFHGSCKMFWLSFVVLLFFGTMSAGFPLIGLTAPRLTTSGDNREGFNQI